MNSTTEGPPTVFPMKQSGHYVTKNLIIINQLNTTPTRFQSLSVYAGVAGEAPTEFLRDCENYLHSYRVDRPTLEVFASTASQEYRAALAPVIYAIENDFIQIVLLLDASIAAKGTCDCVPAQPRRETGTAKEEAKTEEATMATQKTTPRQGTNHPTYVHRNTASRIQNATRKTYVPHHDGRITNLRGHANGVEARIGTIAPDMGRLFGSTAKETSGKLRGRAKRPDAACPRSTEPKVLTQTKGFQNNFTRIAVIVNNRQCRALIDTAALHNFIR
ncbi:hypothetical protein PR048_010189 [Dryococelus australis]|uniref:Gag protein n=1 Tax=Dryococelus australis TaxID=614101 RepID=A0ABQ9I331_9NEOP|nr:hypothetical protein PR048_010189 [Dryococelus australis]